MPLRSWSKRALIPSSALRAALVCGLLVAGAFPAAVSAAATTYHVDCSAGNDSASGTATSTAWRSLSRANNASLYPGDRLLLKRGCTWTGPLKARWQGTSSSPVTISAYGSGELPKIQNGHENVMITGAHLVIENIWTRSDVPSRDSGCENQPAGWRVGFRLMSGSNNTTIRYSRADEQYIGVLLESGSYSNRILNNTLRNNNMKDPDPNSDAGAVGISLMGNDNEVAFNDISGSDACSRQWGRDGAAVEVYGGSRNRIHHNKASQNHNFTELGKTPSADNTYAYNRVTSSLTTANFLVTRGASNSYGPVYRTKLYNNTVHLSGSQSYAIQCYGGCGTGILTMKGNIVVAQDRVGYADNAFEESNNVYWRPGGSPKVYFPISSSSKKMDPKFVNIGSGDLHLQSSSPAINAGSTAAVLLGYTADLDNTSVPQGGAPDMGAYEYRTPAAPVITTAQDAFSRSVSNGWGSISTGGTYRLAGDSVDFDVNGSSGTIALAAGATRAASLPSTLIRDASASVRLRTDRLASGSGAFGYIAVRQSTDGRTEYRLKVRLSPSRTVHLQAIRVVNGIESSIGSEVATGLTHSAGAYIRVRFNVTGSNATSLKGRAWPDGQVEPTTWNVQVADSTLGLQVAGSVGLRAYQSGSAQSSMLVTFDDLSVGNP